MPSRTGILTSRIDQVGPAAPRRARRPRSPSPAWPTTSYPSSPSISARSSRISASSSAMTTRRGAAVLLAFTARRLTDAPGAAAIRRRRPTRARRAARGRARPRSRSTRRRDSSVQAARAFADRSLLTEQLQQQPAHPRHLSTCGRSRTALHPAQLLSLRRCPVAHGPISRDRLRLPLLLPPPVAQSAEAVVSNSQSSVGSSPTRGTRMRTAYARSQRSPERVESHPALVRAGGHSRGRPAPPR